MLGAHGSRQCSKPAASRVAGLSHVDWFSHCEHVGLKVVWVCLRGDLRRHDNTAAESLKRLDFPNFFKAWKVIKQISRFSKVYFRSLLQTTSEIIVTLPRRMNGIMYNFYFMLFAERPFMFFFFVIGVIFIFFTSRFLRLSKTPTHVLGIPTFVFSSVCRQVL